MRTDCYDRFVRVCSPAVEEEPRHTVVSALVSAGGGVQAAELPVSFEREVPSALKCRFCS